MTVDSGAFATTIPRRVAASTSTLSTPDARAADHLQPVGPLDQVGGQLRRRADDDRVVVADPLREVAVRVHVDVVALAEELDPGLGDRLADEDPWRRLNPVRSLVRVERAATAAPRSMSRADLRERELDGRRAPS